MDGVVHKLQVRRALVMYVTNKRRNLNKRTTSKKKKRFWVHPLNTPQARDQQGDFNNLLAEMVTSDPSKFFNHLRMSPECFKTLVNLLESKLERIYVNREPLSPSLRLALTLRYLASGDLMVSIARQFRVGESTVSQIVRETCTFIWEILSKKVLVQPTEENWLKIAEDFKTKWQFPNCLGALDGKHVQIQAPPNCGSNFFNYKGSHSIVLMAVADANYCFTLVDIGAQGRNSDGGIFRSSTMGERFYNNQMHVPAPSKISSTRPSVPHVLLADEAFALTPFLMRPFPGKVLTNARRIYNYRLSRARRIIENAFGILSARFRIFRKPINCSLETVDAIVKATVCLHNYLLKSEKNLPESQKHYCPRSFVDNELPNGVIVKGNWRNYANYGLLDISKQGSNNYSCIASEIRNIFVDFFNNEGAVAFQNNLAHI